MEKHILSMFKNIKMKIKKVNQEILIFLQVL